jgi:chromosome segregation ATPase
MPDRVQDAEANGTTGQDKPKTRTRPATSRNSRQQKSKRFERQNGAQGNKSPAAKPELTPEALLTRLEEHSGQIALLRNQLDEARQALDSERERSKAEREALAEERRIRERLEQGLKREQSARKQAEETLEESRATATALEAQHHLLRAQLKALEHKRRGLLRRR